MNTSGSSDIGESVQAAGDGNAAAAGPALADRYLETILSGDRRGALRLIAEALDAGAPVPDLYLDVLQPAQVALGRLWQENRISVAQEHLATGITQLAIAHLYQHLPSSAPNGYKVLVACVAGELHDLGARIVADFFEMAGFEVRFLGANVPPESLLAMLRAERPDVLALSLALTAHLPALREVLERVREEADPVPLLVVGGNVLDWMPGLPQRVGVDVAGSDIAEIVAEVSRRLGERAAR